MSFTKTYCVCIKRFYIDNVNGFSKEFADKFDVITEAISKANTAMDEIASVEKMQELNESIKECNTKKITLEE